MLLCVKICDMKIESFSDINFFQIQTFTILVYFFFVFILNFLTIRTYKKYKNSGVAEEEILERYRSSAFRRKRYMFSFVLSTVCFAVVALSYVFDKIYNGKGDIALALLFLLCMWIDHRAYSQAKEQEKQDP